MKWEKVKNKFSPLIFISFVVWFICVLAFFGILVLIKDKTAAQLSNAHILALIIDVVLGVASFGIGLIAAVYKVKGKSIKKNSTILAVIKVLFLLGILPLFLLWNILQPVAFFRKIKSLGLGQYWKKFRIKFFVLKFIFFAITACIILPMWVAGYAGAIFFVGAKISLITTPMTISGTGSMYPTFPKGEGKDFKELSNQVVASPGMMLYPSGFEFMGQKFFSHEIGHGDIVTFSNDKTKEIIEKQGEQGSSFVKRVVALPGDAIELRNGILYLNGNPQKEQYIAEPRSTFGGQFLPECQQMMIPDGKLFVMGDNRKGSGDSRFSLGLIDYKDIDHVLPFESQIGKVDKNWRDASHDLDDNLITSLEVDKYVELLNEKRKEAGLKPLKYQPKLKQSAEFRGGVILKYADFSFEADKSGYDINKAMRDAGYSNIVYGELPTQGYYTAEELIENQFEFPNSKKFLLSKEYQEIGVAVARGEMNGCPTQVIVQHVAGYTPPNYKKSNIDSWRSTISDLKKIKPVWEDLKKYDIYYKEHKKDIDRINSIISERISNAKIILSRMEANQWLSAEEQGLIDQDAVLFGEQEKIANKLND